MTLHQVQAKTRITNSVLTSEDYRGQCHCQNGPFIPHIKIARDLTEAFKVGLNLQLKGLCDDLLSLNDIKLRRSKVMRGGDTQH